MTGMYFDDEYEDQRRYWSDTLLAEDRTPNYEQDAGRSMAGVGDPQTIARMEQRLPNE